jgi:hypothetical protein
VTECDRCGADWRDCASVIECQDCGTVVCQSCFCDCEEDPYATDAEWGPDVITIPTGGVL